MSKSELIRQVATASGLKVKESEAAVNAVVEVLTSALSQGERVQIAGFGTFEVRTRKGRTGRNPATGELMEIASSRTPAFKPGKALKDAVRGTAEE